VSRGTPSELDTNFAFIGEEPGETPSFAPGPAASIAFRNYKSVTMTAPRENRPMRKKLLFSPRAVTLSSVNIACQPTASTLLGVVHPKKAGIQIGRNTRSAKYDTRKV